VYLYAVRHKMEQDITTGRTFTSLADKLYFLCELAWEMLSEDKMSLNYREFPDRLRVLFKNEVKEQKHLDHWHYDMMGQTMLIRNDDGDYSPAHRSLLEFFVAYKFAAELGLLADDFLEMAQSQSGIDEGLTPQFYKWSEYWHRDVDENGERKLIAPLAGFESESSEQLQETFGKSPLTKAIIDLLLPSLNLKVKSQESNLLLDLIKSTKAADISYLGGNAATVLVKLNSDVLDYQELKDTNLAHADLVDAGLRGTNLSSANLKNCLITRVFGSVNAIIMSKDDRYFITAHDDKTIRVWDRVSGIELQNLIRHKGVITCLALNEDKQLIYSGSDDDTIQEWNLVDGTYQHTFEHQSSVRAISLSLDGQFLYSAGGNIIREWKVSDGICQRTFESHKNSVNVMSLSRNGQSLYSGSRDGTIEEWRLSDGTCQRTFNGHQDKINAISLSVNGQYLYSSSGDFTIREWRIDSGICQRTFDNNESLMDVIVLSKNGELLYSGSRNGTIEEWKLADGSCRKTVEGHQYSVNCLVVSSDGQFLYSGSYERNIKEWRIADGKCQRTFEGHKDAVKLITLSDNGRSLYSASGNFMSSGVEIKEWELANGICWDTFEYYGNGIWGSIIALYEDEHEQRLYIANNDIVIKKLQKIVQQNSLYKKYSENLLIAIALSVDEDLLYSSNKDGMIREWDVVTGECLRTIDPRLCASANITNVKGLTPAQTDALLALGAFSDD
jgi:WD40 repeat protein